ncbi:MAG: thermonuclease family protein [Bacteriovoracia bacterium]
MGGHYQILLPLLSIFLVRVDLTDLFPLKMPVEVVKVYDGDTVLVRHGSYQMKVRLAKIDSPEKGQPFLNGKGDAGLFSGHCLKRFLSREHQLILSIEKEDVYKRILGDINEVSFRMIELGCASLYPHAVFESEGEKFRYLKALKKAKATRSGLWKYGGIIQPKIWRKISKRGAHRQSRQ